ncbi:hypothetical protein LguiA_030717 [Lonicera macranthoides]
MAWEVASYMAWEAACESPRFSQGEGGLGSDRMVDMVCALVAAFPLQVAWEMALVVWLVVVASLVVVAYISEVTCKLALVV